MKISAFSKFAAAALLATLCLTNAYAQADNGASVTKAIAELHALKDSKVSGTVTFTKESEGLHVIADLKGLTPGEHGIHIHEKGDCSDPEGKSAGGHFNPTNVAHGSPDAEPHHAGDFGNITADASGNAKLDRLVKGISFSGATSILNRSVIVHAKADDLKSQPAGDSGARIACGEIKAEK
jgi:Cu-Zn family superoxide dismutase